MHRQGMYVCVNFLRVEAMIIDENCIRYGLDGEYHVICNYCGTDNMVSSGAHTHNCTSCNQEFAIYRYPIGIIAIRGNEVSSAVTRDVMGYRVVCGQCGLIMYVKCEGEDSVTCVDCGIKIDYSSYPT